MNHLSRFNDKKSKKKVNKQVKRNIKAAESIEGNDLFLKETKSRYSTPSNQGKKKIAKEIKTKLTKSTSKHSKRTTPGTVEGQPGSERQHVHIEGERWNKVIVLQNKVNAKRLTKKITKLKKAQ